MGIAERRYKKARALALAFCYSRFMNTNVVQIRLAESRDMASLTDLAFRSKASVGYDEDFMEACRQELTYNETTLAQGDTWLAERDGKLQGFAEIRVSDGVAEVYAMFVEPEAKRCGIGRRLWDVLEQRARHLAVKAIELDADPSAVSFYESMGCEVIGEAPSGSIVGRMLPRMRKWL